ncbi:MAG: ABC transporter ATP-binding protein [Rhodospirillaceae bacterium]|nr:ABC transporter ATP-binding protein [Rhodospirillaceae bacterium]
MALLEAEDLTVTATIGGGRVDVLRRIGFALEAGKVLGLVGESGAGKSMIGRLIGGVLPPGFEVSSGRLSFDGHDVLGLPRAARNRLLGRDIAFVPQQPMTSLNPVRKIGSLFDEHLRHVGIANAGDRHSRALAALADVHLHGADGILKRYAHQLSGGMCQRVLIAMAFASRPRLLIADEPTTALDVITQARIVQLLRELNHQHGTAVIFITHDLGLAAQVCDDIIVMYAGEAVEQAPAKALLADPRHPYTAALLRCNPGLSGPRRRLTALPDHMPGLGVLKDLPGCRFAPRCPVADAACAASTPPWTEVGPRRWLRADGRCRAAAGAREAEPLALPHLDVAPASPPLLRVTGLGKTFVNRHPLFVWQSSRVPAVRDVSFELRAGEFLGVVGQSGSGKTTLARMLIGLEEPSAGRIELAGEDVTGLFSSHAATRLRNIQMIFQDPQSALNPRRSVASLVTQPMEAGTGDRDWPQRLARARELLKSTGMAPEAAERYPSQLSGGQRQRVNIARALCSTPRVLVADEIVSGLDVSVQAQILQLLLDLRQQADFALLLISHDLSVVRYLCDRVMVMYRGDVVESGKTEEVFANPRHWYTRALIAAVPPDDPHAPWNPIAAEPVSEAA